MKFITLMLFNNVKNSTEIDYLHASMQIDEARKRLDAIEPKDHKLYAGCASVQLRGIGTEIFIPVDRSAGAFWNGKSWDNVPAEPEAMIQDLKLLLRQIDRWLLWAHEVTFVAKCGGFKSLIAAGENKLPSAFAPKQIPGIRAELAERMRVWLGSEADLAHADWQREYEAALEATRPQALTGHEQA